MTQYAYFDHTAPSPSPVLGWYDTGFANYPNLPAGADLLALSPDEWTGRLAGSWAVAGGALVAYEPPAPTLTVAEQAQATIAEGCAITSTGTPAIDGTYAIAGQSWVDMKDEAQYISTFGGFSGGLSALPWVLPSDAAVVFPSTALFLSVVKACADYLSQIKVAAVQTAWVAPAAPAPVA